MRRKRLREEALYYPSVICQGYQILPQNHTPGLAANFWQTSSHFFLFPWGWIYCGKKYGGRKGMALPTFLNCLAINELMTFWTFLAKSCYWNSFLLSFQDYLLLFTFFYHYINNGVFIHLKWVITACVQWTKGEGGKFKTEVMKMSHQVQGFVEKQWRHFRWRNSELVFFCKTVITLLHSASEENLCCTESTRLCLLVSLR